MYLIDANGVLAALSCLRAAPVCTRIYLWNITRSNVDALRTHYSAQAPRKGLSRATALSIMGWIIINGTLHSAFFLLRVLVNYNTSLQGPFHYIIMTSHIIQHAEIIIKIDDIVCITPNRNLLAHIAIINQFAQETNIYALRATL